MSVPSYQRAMPQRYRYEAAKCTSCGKIFFPPRLICDQCKSRSFETIFLKREGVLKTFTVIHVAPSSFVDQAPYAIGVVELKDGVRILSQIVDCEFDNLKIDMPLRLEFRKVSEDGKGGIIHYGYKCVPA
ncbi:MAG: Zn-ribbon domain-containing OB-fold protein [Candidatus Zhuqueibacterota bacterium]